jgi:hypothetical protein
LSLHRDLGPVVEGSHAPKGRGKELGMSGRRRPTNGTKPRPRRGRYIGLALVSVFLLTAGTCKKPPHGISDVSETFEPRAVPWNGVRVYLSSPRHASSGSRGECGWEENINGRIFNLYAADLNTEGDTLTTRGYEARVSPNSRDDGWRLNRDESDNWGADVHIPTHTNANVGCGDTAQYVLVMFKSGNTNSVGLTQDLLRRLDPVVPGGQNSWNCDTLGECAAAAPHVAYLELFFHTNKAATEWFDGPSSDPEATGAMDASPQLGAAVDDHLGSPRASAATEATSALDQHVGFGVSPVGALRDETIAYWEAYQREQLTAACMADAGFDYTPAVSFPTRDTVEIAEGLGAQDRAASLGPRGSSSPATRNRDVERALSAGERDRYDQTLLGESAADVAEADRTGEVPAGRRADEFATGGCVGLSKAAIPSVWDARRQLTADLDALRRNDSGGDAVARFVERHAGLLDDQARRYAGVMDRIAGDDAFATYVATQAAAAG